MPIITFVDRSTGLEVDICFDETSGMNSSEFIRKEMQKWPALRPLVMVFKYFLRTRRLNKPYTGGMGSFLLQLCVLTVLYQHPSRYRHGRRSHQNISLVSGAGRWEDDCVDV